MPLVIPQQLTYATGFARNAQQAANPSLWYGLKGLWVPTLGATGATLHDVSGNNLCGTLQGDAAWKDQGIYCDGSGAYVTLGDPESLRFTGPHSLYWRGTASSASSSGMLSKSGSSGTRASGIQYYAGNIYVWWAANATTIDSLTYTTSLTATTDVVVTFEPGVAVTLYVNGVQAVRDTASIPAAFFNANGLPWNIMSRGEPTAQTAGTVEGVGMWSRILSAGEARKLHANPNALLERRPNLDMIAAAISGGGAPPTATPKRKLLLLGAA